MAKKGQKFNKYPSELKLEIVNKYLNNQGTSRSLAKEYGMSYHSIENMIYTYKRQGHLNGIRTSKVVNNIETKYYLEGNTIVFEDRNNTMLYYLYNGDELLGFVYNGSTYYYHKNVFGDILGIINSNYEEIVTYEYNSWGAISSIADNSGINLGIINPFRYRSYYYDEETKLYYLNSRYYNPEWGRFINGDSVLCSNRDVITSNIFCYVSNNPVNYSDEKGLAWMRPTKWLARKLWKVATAAMRKIGCPNAAKLLEHSLKDNPKDLTYGNINYNSYKNKKLDGIEFENNADLFASLHGADIIVQGNVNDWKLKVQIIDYYDFKFETDYSGGDFKKLAIIANNLAYLDQCTGVVNGYYIYINLEYKIN